MNKNIHNLVRAVIINNNHILVAYNPKAQFDFCYLPGGHIEHYESAQECLTRELQEEIGNLNYKIERFLGCLEYSFIPEKRDDLKCHSHEYNFHFLVECKELNVNQIPQQIEKVAFKWVNLDKLEETNILPGPLKKLLPLWLKLNLQDAFHSQMNR